MHSRSSAVIPISHPCFMLVPGRHVLLAVGAKRRRFPFPFHHCLESIPVNCCICAVNKIVVYHTVTTSGSHRATKSPEHIDIAKRLAVDKLFMMTRSIVLGDNARRVAVEGFRDISKTLVANVNSSQNNPAPTLFKKLVVRD